MICLAYDAQTSNTLLEGNGARMTKFFTGRFVNKILMLNEKKVDWLYTSEVFIMH